MVENFRKAVFAKVRQNTKERSFLSYYCIALYYQYQGIKRVRPGRAIPTFHGYLLWSLPYLLKTFKCKHFQFQPKLSYSFR